MDCDTTGVEPDIALVKYKLLAGGGMLKIVNRGVPDALRRLGYSEAEVTAIIAHIEKFDTIEDVEDNGATVTSGLKPEHLPVFDCAFKPARGKRSIGYLAHLKMMAAAQPFISGAISKTVNMPNECTVAEIRDTYVQAWKMGLKCVAIYRDGSKRSQPLNTKKTNEGVAKTSSDSVLVIRTLRAHQGTGSRRWRICRPSPANRCAAACPTPAPPSPTSSTSPATKVTSPWACSTTARPGELFITMAKEGSTIGGLMDSIGTLTSLAWQYGVPLDALAKKFAHQRFEPSGFTKNPEIRNASSITDYVFRWMALQFVPGYRETMEVARNQPDLAMPGLAEEIKKNVNRPVPELLAIADENETQLKTSARPRPRPPSAVP